MHSIPAVAWKWTLQTAHLANLASQILRSLKGIWMSDVMYLLLPPLSPSGASVVTPQTIRWLTPLVRRISLRPVMKKAPLPPKFKIEWQISQISEKSRARVFCSNGKCWDRLSSLASLSQSHHPWLNAWVTECEESKNANCYSACLLDLASMRPSAWLHERSRCLGIHPPGAAPCLQPWPDGEGQMKILNV